MKQLKELKNDNISKEFIQSRAEELLKSAQIAEAPVNLGLLASFCDIKNILLKDITHAGMLCPLENGGAEIYLRNTDSESRRRFTCCHEITHTFFPDYQLKPQMRTDKHVGRYSKKEWVEYLCDFGASELLMPNHLFSPILEKLGFSIDTLYNLSKTFQSSLESTAIKMVNHDPKNRAIIVWEKKYKPSECAIKEAIALPGFGSYKPTEKIRINFGVGLEKFGFIPSNKSLDETKNIIGRAFDGEDQIVGVEDLNFGNFMAKNCSVQAVPMEYAGTRKVLSLLNLNV